MQPPADTERPPVRLAVPCLLAALALAAAYGQAPLYYSNQNQYFLHGLAQTGPGLLREDGLANTLDPTPLFSGLVNLTARFLHPWAFHLYHALLVGAYAAALTGLFFKLVGPAVAARRWPVFVALLVLVHCAAARWLSYRLLHQDYPWYFQSGVAGQYVLGAMLQPSVFGMLLVVAVCLFVHGRPFLAGTSVALAATMHSTYLLPGALLTLGFLVALLREGQPRLAVVLGAFTLALVLPAAAYVLLTFGPTSPETFAESQDILVNLRIPHHARPDLWLDPITALQLAWVGVALLLVRGTRLFNVLAVALAGMLLLTLAQVATGGNTLALLFPWRVSAVLVPVATAVVLSRLVALPALPSSEVPHQPEAPARDGPSLALRAGGDLPRRRNTVVQIAALAVVTALAAGGIWISVGGLAFRSVAEEVPVMDFVRRTRAPGDVYFLPVTVPDLVKSTRGSLSSDFKPPAEKQGDARIIPIGLQRFRLYTETPIFVDFKSIPYKDTEVIAWRDRLRLAEKVQAQLREGKVTEAIAELRRQGVTHVVLPATQTVPGPALERLYEDPYYRVYRLASVHSPG